ncbi:OmpA family protein [Nannocystis sp.]|uniref:OmpA family protein n=1 Tax=Nannocystis sp. TaxID=1962667 RepID=UPI0025E8674B|nr:OmpA family protein [Nannocystis sp.]MBK7826201.1 OmpA family protein [Nannocystis sp.]
MTRTTLLVPCIAALAALLSAPLARAAAPAGAGAGSSTAAATSPAAVPATTTSPSGQVPAASTASPSGHVPTDSSAPARCQDRRDVTWIRRCLPERNTWELGLFAGVIFPAAHSHELFDPYKQRDARRMGTDFWRPYQTAAPAFGLRAAYFPLRFLGGEVEAGVMPTRVVEQDGPGARATLFSARAHFVGQIPFWRVVPFIVLGSGGIGTTGALGYDFDPMTHFGAGVKVLLGQRTLVRLDVRNNVAARKEVDAGATSYPEILLGFSTVLGRSAPKKTPAKDSDGDGFLDRSDACPYEPGRAPDGCPERDRDGDGFMDSQDACPDVPGIAPDGCPEKDRDGDGFLDSVDRCPDVPGVEPDGCPIPDTDRDGYLDNVDKCVDQPETWNGFDDHDGCPDVVPPAVFRGTVKGIYFDLDKDTIKPRSRPVLDRAVEVFTSFPNIRVEISGHTDSTGSIAHNRDLSRRRAEAVKRYLVEAGIDTARIETRGAGPDEPIDTNRTPAGRAHNRRIEFNLIVDRLP